ISAHLLAGQPVIGLRAKIIAEQVGEGPFEIVNASGDALDLLDLKFLYGALLNKVCTEEIENPARFTAQRLGFLPPGFRVLPIAPDLPSRQYAEKPQAQLAQQRHRDLAGELFVDGKKTGTFGLGVKLQRRFALSLPAHPVVSDFTHQITDG